MSSSLPVEAPMHTPPHPGRIVRQDCIGALGLSIGEAAEALGEPQVCRLLHLELREAPGHRPHHPHLHHLRQPLTGRPGRHQTKQPESPREACLPVPTSNALLRPRQRLDQPGPGWLGS
jgi:hypothetical protein